MPETLHTVDFVEQEEYETEDHPEHIASYDSYTPIPVPCVDERVTFGFFEDEDGERHQTVYREADSTETDYEYVETQEYIVVDVITHYHYSERRYGDGGMIQNRNEVGTLVVVTPQ